MQKKEAARVTFELPLIYALIGIPPIRTPLGGSLSKESKKRSNCGPEGVLERPPFWFEPEEI